MKTQHPIFPIHLAGSEFTNTNPLMKTNHLSPTMRSPIQSLKFIAAAIFAAAFIAPSVFAASQIWTNAPVSSAWTNINNWVGRAVPGLTPQTAANADVATFNSALVGGIGGAGNPIYHLNTEGVRSILFDTANCGAFVIGTGVGTNMNLSHSGNVTMNASVVNPQVINSPILTILPSSTAGAYSFINNSTTPSATLTILNAQHGGATTRATTYTLDGSNTGNNSVTNLLEGGGNATGGFTKRGLGTWILNGANDFKVGSTLSINDGTLVVKSGGEFGNVTTTATVTSNAVLRIDAVNLGIATFVPNLARSGTIRMNGTASLNGVAVTTAAGASPTLATTSASDVFTVGIAANKVSGGFADTVLHTTGPGNIQLPFANNYLGRWSVDAGRLDELAVGALGTGANLNIAAGAIFSVTNLLATTYTLDTAAISANGTGIVVGSTAATIVADAAGVVDLATGPKGISLTTTPTSFTGDLTHPSLYVSQGTLSLGGNAFSINNASGTALGNGTYRLIQQASGTITSAGGYSVVGVTGSGVVSGSVASIVVTGNEVDLVVAPYTPKNLVWSGTGSGWDIATTADWLNGVSASVFNNSDNVTFNSVGIANPSVTLAGTLSPGTVVVDTSGGNYTFNAGQIAGGASLVKKSAGTLLLNEVNTYGGGTVISNGTLQVGINNAVSSTGAGDVAVYGSAVLDLNSFSDTINALSGNGAVDVTSGGASTLTVGNNNNSGVFSGVLRNTSGTLALTKAGNGTETLSGVNTYTGATTIGVGTLKVANLNALGSGNSAVTMSGGILDMASDVVVNSLSGTLGTVANNSTSTTNKLTIQTTSTYGGTIANGSGGGGVSVLINGGTVSLTAANSYSGGTIVAGGAGLIIGNVGSAGSGGIIASNATRVGFANTGNPSALAANNLTTVDNATVLVTGGGNQGNNIAFQFFGSATATNVFTQAFSMGGASSFANFLGTAIISNTANIRFFNALGGGDGTTFDFQGGSMFSRDPNTIRLGALQGGTFNTGIFGPSTPTATFIIGGKGLSTVFSGVIAGSNNIVKVGSGSLTLKGVNTTTNTDSATYTNYFYTPIITYLGSTTISNGTLALVVPNNLSNSPNIILAGGTLNAGQMGYISNQLDNTFTTTNQLLITNGKLEVYSTTTGGGSQVLSGFGTITGDLLADSGSILNPGNAVSVPNLGSSGQDGVMAVSQSVDLEGVTVNMRLNRTNSPTSDKLSAGTSLTVNGGTLNVTNVGPDLVTGDVFTLFNKGITGTGFASISLPAQNVANTITYIYETNLVTAGSSPAGTIKVLSGASAVSGTPPTITNSVSGNQLTLTWPLDHVGWRLQVQTNSISIGLRSNWVDVAGSTTVHTMNFTLDPANGSVFYRMVLP